MESLKVLIIGSNPSESSPDDSPFHPDTKSRQKIDNWLAQTKLSCEVIYLNVCNYKKVNNAPLLTKEIVDHLPALQKSLKECESYKVITVGRAASEAVSRLKIEHFKCPHPSGRNRSLNSKTFVDNMISMLTKYLTTP